MKTNETGVIEKSDLYFSSPSPTAKRLYFYPISAGHYYCEKNYRLVRESFNSIFITYIIDGSFTYVLGGNHVAAHKGEVVILNCFKPHEYYANNYFESIWVHIDGQNCLDFYKEITKNEGNTIKCSDAQHVQSLLFRLFDNVKNEKNSNEVNMSLDIYKLLTELSNPVHISTNNNTSYEESIMEARTYITEHLGDRLTVKQISKTIHMSPSHFSMVFKQQTGFSPYDYVLVTRLNKAKDYLQSTDLTVSQIAYEVGFNSDANFIYFFKQHTGISPNKFRRLKF